MKGRRPPFVFPTDSEAVRNRSVIPRNSDLDANRKYQCESRNYINDDYTYECYQFILNISNSAKAEKEFADYPVRDILIAISKKLLLNELEFLFLSCLLDELKWPVFDDTIKNHASTLNMLTKGLSQQLQYKCMQLYLFLAAYSVKVYLNEDIKMFEGQMNDLLPKFSQIFQTWGNKFAKTALIINPKKLNIKFMNFTYKNDQRSVHHDDLNSKVNELLESAPSLEVPRRQGKPKTQQEPVNKSPQPCEVKDEESDLLPPPPMIRQQSSRHSQYDLPNLPWPVTGDSYFPGGFLSRDFSYLQNVPSLIRMESAGSQYNFPSLSLRNQPSIDKEPPAS